MSLNFVLKRKLLHHLSCSKCQPHCVIYQRNGHKGFERYFIHRKSLSLPHHTGIRLLSISLNKFSFISRLTSYFIQKKAEVNKPSKDLPDNHPNGIKDSESSISAVEENSTRLQSKHKWISLISKLPVASLYNISSPVSAKLKEDYTDSDLKEKRQVFHKQINESTEMFLEKYNTDLDLILKKANPPTATKRRKQNVRKHKSNSIESTTDISKQVKYPKIKTQHTIPVKTDNYEKTKQYLQSLGIPCDDLEHYPNIQEMDKDTILKCIDRLKEIGIYVVFSLFLVDRISFELKLMKKESILGKKKQTSKIPLMSFPQVKAYVELCQLLEKPDLDIRNLLEQLGKMGHFCDILHLHRKVKKLREVGATAKDIWSNLELLLGFDFFDNKIELYKKYKLVGQGPFPVHLFLAKTIASFQEQIAVGSEIDAVARLLDVSVADVQGCWGFKKYNTSMLQYKVKMCLAAGISKNDIFNNLAELVRFPVEQCHAVTNCFRTSGLPASVFVLREMVNAAKLNGYRSDNVQGDKNVPSANADQTCTAVQLEEDWVGGSKMSSEEVQVPAIESNSLHRNNVLSTKKHQRRILELIRHLLQLDVTMMATMRMCSVNVSAIAMLDVQKNLEYLISKDYTRDNIAKCPLVLAHPHVDLMRVVSEVDRLILLQLQSVSVPSSMDSFSGFLSRSSPDFTSTVCAGALKVNHDENKVENNYLFRYSLLANPEQRLNAFQYFLEKENSFSLASMD
ncbi:hypothetical protein BsWGS_03627 [Bradybaena similaris]